MISSPQSPLPGIDSGCHGGDREWDGPLSNVQTHINFCMLYQLYRPIYLSLDRLILPIYLSISVFVDNTYLTVYLSLSACLPLFFSLAIYRFIVTCLTICMSVHPSIYPIHQKIYSELTSLSTDKSVQPNHQFSILKLPGWTSGHELDQQPVVGSSVNVQFEQDASLSNDMFINSLYIIYIHIIQPFG